MRRAGPRPHLPASRPPIEWSGNSIPLCPTAFREATRCRSWNPRRNRPSRLALIHAPGLPHGRTAGRPVLLLRSPGQRRRHLLRAWCRLAARARRRLANLCVPRTHDQRPRHRRHGVVVRADRTKGWPAAQVLSFRAGSPAASSQSASVDLDPDIVIEIDGRRHAAQLLFADDFVVVADAADGSVPVSVAFSHPVAADGATFRDQSFTRSRPHDSSISNAGTPDHRRSSERASAARRSQRVRRCGAPK